MADFPANLTRPEFDGSNASELVGDGVAFIGYRVASVGDIDSDGIDDVLITDTRGFLDSYVVYGRTGGFGKSFDLTTLDGTAGFRIGALGDGNGITGVAAAGDVNGDGIDDFIVGTGNDDANGTDAGRSFVVFGQTSGFGAEFDLNSLEGSNGFELRSSVAGDRVGTSVASAGDVNGDGIGDLIVGAPGADANGADAGASYVLFGKKGGLGAKLNLENLDGTTGFKLTGAAAGDAAGSSVSSAGDINGDGYADLLIGAPKADADGTDSGASYVVFGRAGGFDRNVALGALNGTTGFKLTGLSDEVSSGQSVASAGDVNGDGFDDLVVGGNNRSHIVFGKASGYDPNIDLSSLNGRNGFSLTLLNVGSPADFVAVSSAGDMNGDGFDDIVVGSIRIPEQPAGNGASWVVFGKAGDFNESIDLNALDGTDGFRISGTQRSERVGLALSSGDVNGDGYDDLLIGRSSSSAYIVYGRAPTTAVDRVGTDIDNTIRGGAFDDTLSGRGGDDILIAAAGDDTLVGGAGKDRLDGGRGADIMAGGEDDDSYVVDSAGDRAIERANAGTDTVSASVTHTLELNVENLILTGASAIGGTGNALANRLTGNGAGNVLDGGAGSDTLTGGAGNDTYVIDSTGDRVVEAAGAGNGVDTVRSSVSVAVLAANVEALTLSGTANLSGTGNSLANTITGNAGANILSGGLGSDILKGGAGKDTFLFNAKPGSANLDHITDFRAIDDTIRLENAIFTALTKTGTIKADEFATITSKSAVVDTDAHILYEKASGTLYYDADGGSASGRVAFAVIDNHTSLTFQDFQVV